MMTVIDFDLFSRTIWAVLSHVAGGAEVLLAVAIFFVWQVVAGYALISWICLILCGGHRSPSP
jgi:hypothetical protein